MTESTEALPVSVETSPEPATQEKPPEEAKKRKIAVLGSATSSVALAPFKNQDWEIWGCSPGNRQAPRVDVWFEFHNVEKMEREGLTEWLEWLAKQPLVFMQQGPTPRFPLAKKYPIEGMVATIWALLVDLLHRLHDGGGNGPEAAHYRHLRRRYGGQYRIQSATSGLSVLHVGGCQARH